VGIIRGNVNFKYSEKVRTRMQSFFGGKKKFIKEIKVYQPDLIGFSCMNAQVKEVINIAGYLKRNGVDVPIILGGIYPTLYPEILRCKTIDYISRGESEYTLFKLMSVLGEKRPNLRGILGLGYKEDGQIIENPHKAFYRLFFLLYRQPCCVL